MNVEEFNELWEKSLPELREALYEMHEYYHIREYNTKKLIAERFSLTPGQVDVVWNESKWSSLNLLCAVRRFIGAIIMFNNEAAK